ncbi:MAG: hypothetical protein KAS12_04490 [Candidatus Aenigmarchaeota archaeon]|nr:hypothetical protein [Candidatus Aenigmarchaeota archaeon]
MTNKKGMGAALTLVISIVVLIVVALALITMTSGNVAKVGDISKENTNIADCGICKTSKCIGVESGIGKTVTCDSCDPIDVEC